MSPRSLPTLSMMESQASMHSAQVMHSSCWPSRMSMPIGHTATQALQSTQSPMVSPAASAFLTWRERGSPRQSL
jgi:hypothetical protein